MRRIILSALLAASLLPAAAVAQGKQDFTLVNRTGYDIDEVYVSPVKTDDWEEDVMGRDTLDNGDSVDISFGRKDKSCRYDLKVVYSDGEEAEWDSLDLCSISRVVIRYDRKKGETWVEHD